MKTITTILLIAGLLSACATRGTNFDMADVNAFQPGVTTCDDAVAKLGKPKSQNYAQDGSKTMLWIFAQASIAGSSSKGTKIAFDKDCKMTRVMSKVE